MNILVVLIYILLAVSIFAFLKISDLQWNNKPILKLSTRLAIALIVPLILIVAFMIFMALFVVLAIIFIIIFIVSFLEKRR